MSNMKIISIMDAENNKQREQVKADIEEAILVLDAKIDHHGQVEVVSVRHLLSSVQLYESEQQVPRQSDAPRSIPQIGMAIAS